MTLTEQVELSLRSAQEHLREGLAFSGKAEKPIVSKHIADMSLRIDAIIEVSDLVKEIGD